MQRPADKIDPIVAPRVGPVGDHHFHGATGGSFSVHVCTLRAAPITSEENWTKPIRSIQKTFSLWSRQGLSSSSQRANVLRKLFCKPEREIAGCLLKYFFHCIHCIPQPHSAAIDMNRRANLFCMDVKDMVSWPAATGRVEHPGCPAGRRCWLEVENCSSWFPACRQHLRFPFPWVIRCVRNWRAPGSSGEDPPPQLPPPPQIHRQWWLSLLVRRGIFDSLTRPVRPARGLARRCICKAGACSSSGWSR